PIGGIAEVALTGAGEVRHRGALGRVAVDLAVHDGERRDQCALALLDEQAGSAYVRHRQPDLPLVERFHRGRLVTVADAVYLVGDLAADIREVAVAHDRGGLAGGRVGDLGQQLGGGGRGCGLGYLPGVRAGGRPSGG